MVRMETHHYSQQEWHEIVSQFSDVNLIQLWEYGEAKAKTQGWQVVRQVFYDGSVVVGAAQALLKMVPYIKRGLVWINRAPLFQRAGAAPDFVLLEEILKELRQYWVDQRKMYLRIVPPVPEVPSISLHVIPNSQWMSAVLDLTKSEQELRAGLDKKWRNCLTKAEKLGLIYGVGSDEQYMEELVSDYEALLARKGFASVTPEFVMHLQRLLPEDRKMLVLCGRLASKKLGSILIARYGDVAEYLVGVITPEGQKLNAGQFLLWHAMVAMKRLGIKRFDLGGLHPDKTPKGILHFKKGIGGKSYSFVGELDEAKGIISHLLRLIIKYRV